MKKSQLHNNLIRLKILRSISRMRLGHSQVSNIAVKKQDLMRIKEKKAVSKVILSPAHRKKTL